MKARRITLTLAIATLIFSASATTAYAQLLFPSYILGNLYQVQVNGCNDPIIINLPTPIIVPLTSPGVTFLVPTKLTGIPLDFNDLYDPNGFIVEAWLATPGSSNHAVDIRGLQNVKYNYLSDYPCTFVTVIDFTGEVTVVKGEVFTFDVDDAIWLEIGGSLVTQANGAPLPYQATYTGPSGTFPFRLIYLESNDFQARLKVTHN